MATTYYHTVDGEVLGETTNAVRTEYLHDALGSVTGTTDSTSAVKNTYRYKPLGTQLAKTGAAVAQNFQWVGTAGYRMANRKHTTHYVRARHFSDEGGLWTTVDRR